MEVIIKNDYDGVCMEAASIIQEACRHRSSPVLGFPTGKTPLGLYEKLIGLYNQGEIDFASVMAFTLDEYVGLEASHPQSFAYYMDNHLFRHVNIKGENIFRLNGQPGNIEEHCRSYERKIQEVGGIDVQILGIGKNGHIAFNEPGSSLSSRTRLKILTPETVAANRSFFQDEKEVPRFCLTMGIGTILETKTALLLASGKDKSGVIAKAVEGPVTASVPASALQLHARAIFVIDEAAASGLTNKDYYRWAYENKGRTLNP
ncbi:MAG: glucosamine-6-phosphate deaminase [candidate division Zixibacteria bacterium RBG_16_53_22]|nr:MAG: glucosamine-6-phosphate deaminase [candidate division Zixibacteria bacterium RBG_16_53_22]